jgi:hypothetical protein
MSVLNFLRCRLAVLFATFGLCWSSCGRADDLPIDDLPVSGEHVAPVKVGEFPAERLIVFSTSEGLPDDNVLAIAQAPQGTVLAGTSKGLVRWDGKRWKPCSDRQGRALSILPQGDSFIAAIGSELVRWHPATGETSTIASLPSEFASDTHASLAVVGDTVYLGGEAGLFALAEGKFAPVEAYQALVDGDSVVHQLAAAPNGELAVAAANGLFVRSAAGDWQSIKARSSRAPTLVRQRPRRWLPRGRPVDALRRRGWSALRRLHDLCGRRTWRRLVRHEDRRDSIRRADLELSPRPTLDAR